MCWLLITIRFLLFIQPVFYYRYRKLNGCETWSLTLREERRLRVFENRVLRRIFGPEIQGNKGVEKNT